MNKKKTYLSSTQLAKALTESQSKGEPTIEACNCFRLIAQHLLGNSRYRRYPHAMQEDMSSAALLKCIKNIKNFKQEFSDRCFNYYTRVVEHAFWEVLSKHYKQYNIQRALARDLANQIAQTNPASAKAILDNLLQENTTHIIKG